MGTVIVRPMAPSDCPCERCFQENAAPVRYRINEQAAQAAVNTLEIRRPVLIECGPIRSPAPGHTCHGQMHGWVGDHWLIECNDRDWVSHHTFSHTVWHELGHVLDYEHRIDVTGEAISPDHANHLMQQHCAQIQTMHDYANSREEKFANEIMHRYGHNNLEQGVTYGHTTPEHLRPTWGEAYPQFPHAWR